MSNLVLSMANRAWSRAGRSVAVLAIFLLLLAPVNAQTLHINDGVTVKFGPDAGLVVRGGLEVGEQVTFTSLADDDTGGQTGATPATPARGDWAGVDISRWADAYRLNLNALTIQYADTGLDLAGGNRQLKFLQLLHNNTGIAVSNQASVGLQGTSWHDNGTGIETRDGSDVSIEHSEIAGNDFGVRNLSPSHVVAAQTNWWGSDTGPTASDNPGGSGDAVSDGVDYGQYLDEAPLLDCSLQVADGNYQVTQPEVTLDLACRNAVEYRLAPNDDFHADPDFQPMANQATFTLQPPPGRKQIYAQYRSAEGATVTVSLPRSIEYQSEGTTVSIVQPADQAIVKTDTTIIAQASAPNGIDQVKFYAGSQLLGVSHDAPYQQQWLIDGFSPGTYQLRVVAQTTDGTTSRDAVTVQLHPADVDPAPPTFTQIRFNGEPVSDGFVIDSPGTFRFTVAAPSGIVAVAADLDGINVWQSHAGGTHSVWLTFANIANGPHQLVLHAVNGFGKATTEKLAFTLQFGEPPAPQIVNPADGAHTQQNTVNASGTAQYGSRVQVYVDGNPAGDPVDAGTGGTFAETVTLPGEGTHALTADARNSRGASPMSDAHQITYRASTPEITFTSPKDGATIIDAGADLSAAVLDATGVAKVQFLLDGDSLKTLTAPPWAWHWDVGAVANGAHTLAAKAVNLAGYSDSAEIQVDVAKQPPPPPPVPSPYVGKLQSVSPQASYGEQPIVVRGRAEDRATGEPAGDSLLHILLKNGKHVRTVQVATQADGTFTWTFHPGPSDAGVYRVSVRHPDQNDAPWQGQFAINRLFVSPSRYRLQASRTVEATIPVRISTSSGQGAAGIRIRALPAAQPSGSLPAGIQITSPDAITLGPDASRTLDVGFLGGQNAAQSGTIILTVTAKGSGSAVRGRVAVHYQLRHPVPALIPHPTALQGGLQQGDRITLSADLENAGLLSARGVSVELLNSNGTGPAPTWMHLSSPADLGTLEVGEHKPMQVTVAPGGTVVDGIYHALLRVDAANTAGGDLPVAVAVTRSGKGGIRFHASDFYTETLDDDGNPILGLADAHIRIEHETIPSLRASVDTDDEGVGVITDMPPGHYRWHATAPDHESASGLVEIMPGIKQDKEIFLDNALVTVEWDVTETTIPDEYEVVVEAEYETQVPFPNVVIEPVIVNLPPMQEGEIYSGQLTISNYGLVRADNLEFTPPPDDPYFHYEFEGQVPDSLGAHERITLNYTITALQNMSGSHVAPLKKQGVLWHGLSATRTATQSLAGTCQSYRSHGRIDYSGICANGDEQNASNGMSWGRTWGGSCSAGNSGSTGGGGNGGGGWGGGWGGPVGGPPTGLGSGPGCTPNCDKCCKGGGKPGGG